MFLDKILGSLRGDKASTISIDDLAIGWLMDKRLILLGKIGRYKETVSYAESVLLPFWDRVIAELRSNGVKGNDIEPIIFNLLSTYYCVATGCLATHKFEKGLAFLWQARNLFDKSMKVDGFTEDA